jgi:hypothetical protein
VAITYNDIPQLSAWKKDSSVALAWRSNDPVLKRIDELVQAYSLAPDGGARLYIGCDLFFTLDYWLKVYKKKSKMEKGREPAVMALYKCVVEKLGSAFGSYYGAKGGFITPNNLHTALELWFGRTLSGHGVELDLQRDCAIYLKRAEVAKYRLRFKNGKAYQFPWWDPPSRKPKVVLAESSRAYNYAVFDDATGYRKNWGGFAMSMGRDLYMAKHHCTKGFGKQGNFYHSSYLGGDSVMLAGTMLIEGGILKAISTDSGHYQPDLRNVVNLLQMLKMHGVEVANIDVQNHTGLLVAKGGPFLASNGNYARMLQREQANWTHLANRRDSERDFMDDIKYLWDEGIKYGLYTNDMPGRTYFIGHVLPTLHYEGLNYQYALDAFNKATIRDTSALGKYWAEKWRGYLKSEDVKNLRKNLDAFLIWVKKSDPVFYGGWTHNAMKIDAEKGLKEAGHQFDA